jgi:hypothetical protein
MLRDMVLLAYPDRARSKAGQYSELLPIGQKAIAKVSSELSLTAVVNIYRCLHNHVCQHMWDHNGSDGS